MKLLTVSHLFPNSAEPFNGVFVSEFVTALSRKVESHVLAPVSHFPILRPAKKVKPLEESRGSTVYHPRYLALPRQLLESRWKPFYRSIVKTADTFPFLPDIVHAHWLYPDGFAADRWAKLRGLPSVVTIHGPASLGIGVLGRQTRRSGDALRSLDRIIVVSSELRQILMKDFEISGDKIRVIHNGLDPSKFPKTSQEEARRRLGLAINRRVVVCVARLSEEKRLDLLIEAVSKCETDNLQVFVIGVGPLREILSRQIEEKLMQNRIVLTGGIRHECLSDWYHAADLFCLTSAEEGCPVVVLEALGCGLPVVATPVGAVPDIIRHGENGLITNPDGESIAQAIDKGLEQNWDRELIEEEGSRRTWEAVADRTIGVYEELLSPV